MSDELDHLKAAYLNSHDRIRDMDSKSNILIGFQIAISSLLLATGFSVSKGELDIGLTVCPIPCPSVILVGLWGLSLLAGLLSIIFLLSTLKARAPGGSNYHTVLFPFYDENTDSDKIEKALTSLTDSPKEHSKLEYRKQIKQVGAILFKKMTRIRIAVDCLSIQLVFLIASVISFLMI